MGGLFSCSISHRLPDVFIDFDNVAPINEEETRIVTEFNEQVLKKANELIPLFSAYKDQSILIGQAISKPSEENSSAAFSSLLPNIRLQLDVYKFSEVLVSQFLSLLEFVINLIQNDSIQILDQYAAVTKSFAQAFDLILRFDEIKLSLFKLLNDLSYFRRVGMRNTNDEIAEMIAITNSSTVFYGQPSPFLFAAANKVKLAYASSPEKLSQILTLLGSITDVATSVLSSHRFPNEETNLLCLRCITGAVLLYDHVSPNGPFTSNSPMAILHAMRLLVNYEPKQTGLINTIKFSSKNLNNSLSMQSVKDLFNN